ncbi:MAG: prepilin-type cleavage/methylation domain-containing protein [Parachlamydia sp.]|nr:MAG: prepilin-type cleavage/methylation domain-containing protein [Parachlamydia sp.]
MIRRLSFFTLVEILIVFLILSLVTAVVGINISKALEEQRFRTEVDIVLGELRLAQDLMLILKADVQVKFAQGTEGINYSIETESQTTKNWVNSLKRPHPKLKTIRGISFKDELDLPTVPGAIVIHFLSKGSVMSRGILRLSNSSDAVNVPSWAQVKVINLYGYPHPIVSTTPSKNDPIDLPQLDASADAGVTNFTRNEIRNLIPPGEDEEGEEE